MCQFSTIVCNSNSSHSTKAIDHTPAEHWEELDTDLYIRANRDARLTMQALILSPVVTPGSMHSETGTIEVGIITHNITVN